MVKRDAQNQFLIALGILVALHFIWPGTVRVYYPYNLIGLIPIIAGIICLILSKQKLNKAGITHNPYDEPEELVTEGIYKYTRNPVYLGFILILLGVAGILATLPAILLALVYIFNTHKYNVLAEEQILLKKFGNRFTEYCSRTRRWI